MDEDLDPEVLAAIEASKHEAEEEDLLIKAALEESIRESTDEQKNVDDSEDAEQNNVDNGDDDPLNGDKENNEDDPLSGGQQNNEESETEEAEAESAVDQPHNFDDNIDISKIKENGNSEEKENSNSEETPNNGHTSEDTSRKGEDLFSNYKLPNGEEEETDRESNVKDKCDQNNDSENNKVNSPGGEIRLDGEPVIDEDPFNDDANEKSDTGDVENKCKLVKVELSKVKCDPSSLSKNGVKKEAGSESDSEDETALSKRSRAAKSSGKRKRSESSDSDSDSGGRKSLRPRGKSKGLIYTCPFCTFNR